ncbi:MAG: hypothetical protein K2M98_08010 [Muribaculum sp.]|nr:hypothetical protein [Muribaculum sp.]
MKKLVLLLAVVFSVSLFSCGGSNKAAEEAVDTVAVEEVAVEEVAVVDTLAADSVAADSAAVEAPVAE